MPSSDSRLLIQTVEALRSAKFSHIPRRLVDAVLAIEARYEGDPVEAGHALDAAVEDYLRSGGSA